MLTWHSFLQSVMFFVRSISVKLTKKHYRSSSVLMSGAVVIAVVAFSANGFGGGGKNAMAAPRTVESLEADEEPETEALLEGSSFVTEAKIQFGLLNTGSEGQHLAGALLERDVRDRQRRQADAQIEIEALQKQILKEKEIAVIEDSHFSRLHLKDIFDRYKIKSLRYFESGTELAESKKIYDIYLLDLVLQDEFGKNIIAELREKSDESLIFAVTSLNNPNLLADVIDSGADDIIIKPIEEKIFIAKLKSFVRKLQ